MIIGGNIVFSLLGFLVRPRFIIGYFMVPICGIITLVLFTLLVFSNPGIAPNNLSLETAKKVYDHAPLRECRRCHAFVPPHTYHCDYCDVCILDVL